MDTINVDRARRSVLHVYELIQALFNHPASSAQSVIADLMHVIADTFSLVTPDGRVVGRDQFKRLFSIATGTRPGVEIRIRDMRTIWQEGTSVALRYKEIQRVAGTETTCQSLVIVDASRLLPRWIFLHESR